MSKRGYIWHSEPLANLIATGEIGTAERMVRDKVYQVRYKSGERQTLWIDGLRKTEWNRSALVLYRDSVDLAMSIAVNAGVL